MLPPPFEGRRREIHQVVDAGELLLDDLVTVRSTVSALAPGYVALMDTCGGAMSGYASAGRPRMAKHTTERDDDGDDPREYRAVDEKLRHAVRPAGTVANQRWRERRLRPPALARRSCGAVAFTGFALTGMPGPIFCRPETMTWSPSASPLEITQSLPTADVVTTRFCATMPSAPATSTYGPWPSRCTASCGTRNPLFSVPAVAAPSRTCPAAACGPGFGTLPRNATAPVVGFTL